MNTVLLLLPAHQERQTQKKTMFWDCGKNPITMLPSQSDRWNLEKNEGVPLQYVTRNNLRLVNR